MVSKKTQFRVIEGEKELRRVAIHEAGHAVAQHRLGFACMG